MDEKEETIKWLIRINEDKTKKILELEEEIKQLKKFIALREEYK